MNPNAGRDRPTAARARPWAAWALAWACTAPAVQAAGPTSAAAGVPAAAAKTAPAAPGATKPGTVSVAFRDASLAEVFEMLSRRERVNILLGKGVTGTVSVNLYDVPVAQAIRAIAEAAGYAAEVRNGDYVIVERKEVGLDSATGNTRIRSFKIQYSEPKAVADILTKHLSRFGKITPLPDRRMLVVEDLPEFLERVDRVLQEVDVAPRQILVEAKILEIALNDDESFGIDWSKFFASNGPASSVGTKGLAFGSASLPTQGLFFNLMNKNIQAYLTALSSQGRVHTLSTPKLLALENQEALTKIGDNIGYRVTTTINNVTTESIQFLETGVILRFQASVDERGRVVMKIHPEVSSGSVANGIPSKNTTEVTTQLVADDGQAIFIGGLIKTSSAFNRAGVPVLGDLPVVGRLFRNRSATHRTAETVVLITPKLVEHSAETVTDVDRDRVELADHTLKGWNFRMERRLDWPDADRSP
jgi:type II secretory pathway component GspD/PulD (secretin)